MACNKYKIMMLLLIFLEVISLNVSNKLEKSLLSFKDIDNDDLQVLLTKIFTYVYNNSNSSILTENILLKEDCLNEIINIALGQDKEALNNIMNASGKDIADPGLENECVNIYNLTYAFITYELKPTGKIYNPQFFELAEFLERNSFFTGICCFTKCNQLYRDFLDKNLNKKFFDKIEDDMGVYNITLFKLKNLNDTIDYNKNLLEQLDFKIFYAIVLITVIYFIFRILISFFVFFLYDMNSEHDEIKADISIGESLDNSNISEEDIINFSQLNESDRINFFKSKPMIKFTDSFKKTCIYKLTKIFSFRRSFKVLFTRKTRYYNDTNIELFGGIRFYILFLLTYNKNLYSLAELPHRDYSGYNFFVSFTFSFSKYTTYGCISYIMLNGILCGFKLMSYLKKNKHEFNVRDIFVFLIRLVPSFCLFVFSFFILNLNISKIGYYISDDSLFEYFTKQDVNSKKCVIDPFSVFIPFKLQYFDDNYDSNDYSSCFRYIYIISSEFYCFIFFIIIFYISNKLKNYKFDFSIFFLTLINIVLSFLSYTLPQSSHDKYSLNRIFGEVNTFKFPHLFFNPYFIGINIGIAYFYFKELTSSNPFLESNKYRPFFYNFYIMKYFDKLNKNIKYVFIIFTSLATLIMSLNFYISLIINKVDNDKETILLDYSIIKKFIYIYENNIFLILCAVFLLSTVFYAGDETYWKKLLSNSFFIPFNRISFTFLCFLDNFIYIFYSFYNVQIYLTFINSLLMTIPLFSIILIVSVIQIVLFDIPFRIILILAINPRKHKKITSLIK